ncbi:MAG: class I SAM-dependent methyltransferase [Elusimicrobia bacterium]|nr:class I SAM-dependent methyltransferase [Elusimicrobiota bacterium]
MPNSEFFRMFRAYGGIGRGSLFFCYRWLVFSHEIVSDAVPERGLIYDLGSGYGIFSLFLALRRCEREIVAVDFSKRRTASGRRAARTLGLDNIRFVEEDFFKVDLRPSQAVVLNDVLHHVPNWDDQRRLLGRVCELLAPGGKLVIVDVARRPLLKFCLGWTVDHVLYFGDDICYLQFERLKSFLADNGIGDFAVRPLDAGRPYSNVLCTGVKR